jgi:hypothetical protein
MSKTEKNYFVRIDRVFKMITTSRDTREDDIWKNLEKIEKIREEVYFTYLIRDRTTKEFQDYNDATEYADYKSKYFIKFSDGYISREDTHNDSPMICKNVIITVVDKRNQIVYWVTEYKEECKTPEDLSTLGQKLIL